MIVEDDRLVSYAGIDAAAARLAAQLLEHRADLGDARIAIHAPPGAAFVTAVFAIWKAGGIAVPLALSHPLPELDYVLGDAGVSVLITADRAGEDVIALAQRRSVHHVSVDVVEDASEPRPGPGGTPAPRWPALTPARPALMLYTSGTTGRPKGVVSTHGGVAAQIETLVRAWEWTPADRTLLVLPLHHVHGLINVIGSAVWSGATCEVHRAFDPDAVWDRLASGELTVFTAVPTIYHRLVASFAAAPPEVQAARRQGCRSLRLMMCGSAALPVTLLERWREISGQTLLERYGMTEIGMALANPLHGDRRPGSVGLPLPGVDVRLVDEHGAAVADGEAGELEVRGPSVFLEYWQRPEATRAAFRDGWFRTGDIAVRDDGRYRLLGRASSDILKTGGFKVSALEIEDVLREHPAISDCAVVGLDDPEWGKRVAAAVELRPGATLDPDALADWAKARLAPYKVPRSIAIVARLPRNAMGKVLKNDGVGGAFQRSGRSEF